MTPTAPHLGRGPVALGIMTTLNVSGLKPFKGPVAYFDSDDDSIEVNLSDCSVTREDFNQSVTLLMATHPKHNVSPFCGLLIHNATQVLKDAGLTPQDRASITALLRRLPENTPNFKIHPLYKTILNLDLYMQPEKETAIALGI